MGAPTDAGTKCASSSADDDADKDEDKDDDEIDNIGLAARGLVDAARGAAAAAELAEQPRQLLALRRSASKVALKRAWRSRRKLGKAQLHRRQGVRGKPLLLRIETCHIATRRVRLIDGLALLSRIPRRLMP